MKKVRSFILFSLILAISVFIKPIFADGIDGIRNEFITCCKKV